MESTEKSLAQWRHELRVSRKNWGGFYTYFMGKSPPYSNLFRLLDLYGEWALFEAIVESGARKLDLNKDPFPYVATVTKQIWKRAQQEEEEVLNYSGAVEEAKRKTRERIDDLLAKKYPSEIPIKKKRGRPKTVS